MSDGRKKESDAKQPYLCPQVVRVSLRPEEAVLGHCKISSSAGPISGGCGGALRCKSLGS